MGKGGRIYLNTPSSGRSWYYIHTTPSSREFIDLIVLSRLKVICNVLIEFFFFASYSEW